MKKVILLLCVFALTCVLSTLSVIGLTYEESTTEYNITNAGYYKAVIPKETQSAGGMIKQLYIYNGTGYSPNVVYTKNPTCGLGFIEGNSIPSSENGLLGNAYDITGKTILFLINESSEIKIKSYGNYRNLSYILTWTFWDGVPYFKGKHYANETTPNGRLTNQYQFCQMVNNSDLTPYSTNEDGNLNKIDEDQFMQYNSNKSDIFPVLNLWFNDWNVSLGWITTAIKNPLQVDLNTGDWNFEFQYNFYGSQGSTNAIFVEEGQEREMELIYYVDNGLTNNNILSLSQNRWNNVSATKTNISNFVHGGVYSNDMYFQPLGLNAELYNSFIHLSNNLFSYNASVPTTIFPTTWIRIYQSYFASKENRLFPASSQPYMENIVGDLEARYKNGTANSTPSSIPIIRNYSITNGKKLNFVFNISGLLLFDLNFSVWDNSDKMHIEGSVTNLTDKTINVSDIELVYHLDVGSTYYEAQNITNYTSVSYNLDGGDNDISWYDYSSYETSRNKNNLVYKGNSESIPTIAFNISSLEDGEYMVWAYLKCAQPSTNLNYNFSFDNSNWFSVNTSNSCSSNQELHEKTYLGKTNSSGGVFLYMDDHTWDKDWMTIDGFSVSKLINLNTTTNQTYAIRWNDKIYDKMEQIIYSDKELIFTDVTKPKRVYGSRNSTIWQRPELIIKIFQNKTGVSNFTDVSYSFNVTLWNRIGWNNDTTDITELHSYYDNIPSFNVKDIGGNCKPVGNNWTIGDECIVSVWDWDSSLSWVKAFNNGTSSNTITINNMPTAYNQIFNQTSTTPTAENVNTFTETIPPNNRSFVFSYLTAFQPKFSEIATTINNVNYTYYNSSKTLTVGCEGTGDIDLTNLNNIGEFYKVSKDGIDKAISSSDDFTLDSCSTWTLEEYFPYANIHTYTMINCSESPDKFFIPYFCFNSLCSDCVITDDFQDNCQVVE